MLSIQYPLKYTDVFDEFNDFDVWDMSLEPDSEVIFKRKKKEQWHDYSKSQAFEVSCDCGPNLIIFPQGDEPATDLLRYSQWTKQMSCRTMGLWAGDKIFLDLLPKAITDVGIPWKVNRNSMQMRSLHITLEDAVKYHAYEFSNLDELRRLPWKSLHTSVPITAAIMGIDLTRRERRPKALPLFSYDMSMTTEQIDLALSNIEAIKEAMQYAQGNRC